MKTFHLAGTVTVSAYTTVEADTLEEAIRIAEHRPVEFAGGPHRRSEWWLVEDIDGSPTEIEAED